MLPPPLLLPIHCTLPSFPFPTGCSRHAMPCCPLPALPYLPVPPRLPPHAHLPTPNPSFSPPLPPASPTPPDHFTTRNSAGAGSKTSVTTAAPFAWRRIWRAAAGRTLPPAASRGCVSRVRVQWAVRTSSAPLPHAPPSTCFLLTSRLAHCGCLHLPVDFSRIIAP